MTEREKEVLDFIIRYREKHHFSPTLREIGLGVNLKSTSSVHRYVVSLTSKGYLECVPDKMRTLVPVCPKQTTA